MEINQKAGKEEIKQVIFTLGEEEYGLDIGLVNAIEKYTDIVRIPNAPSYIRGIINLRGEVIPVFNLRKKFGMPEKSRDEESKLIITRSNNILIAYEVDSVKEIIEIRTDNISETPALIKSSNTAYIQCVANLNGRMILLLNHNGILSDTEKEKIETLLVNQ